MPDSKQRLKSPPYPALDLESALEKARQLQEVAKGFAVPVPSAATAWGYSPKSSSITAVAGALNQFGLLEDGGAGESRRFKVSSLGEKILLDKRPDSIEREKALKVAALSPKVFQEMWERYGTVDVDDGTIIYDLTLGRKSSGRAPFSETAATDVAAKYKSSLTYAGFDQSDGDAVRNSGEDAQPLDDDSNINQAGGVSGGVHSAYPSQNEISPTETFEERKALDEGAAILIWPKNLSSDSVEDMEYWLNGVLRQIKRRSQRSIDWE